MGDRRAHLVGSIPAVTAAKAMRLAVERLGSELDYLPDGETGDRRNWVISMIEALRVHPAFMVVKDGDWSDYDKTPWDTRWTSPPSLGRREPDAAMAAMDRIKLLLSDQPPAGLD